MMSAALFVISAAQGAPFVVTTTANDGAGSLRQGISATPAGGSIDFDIPNTQPGYDPDSGIFTITLTGGELQIGRDLTITGPTNTKIVISGNSASRVFNIVAGNVTMTNLTVANGRVAGANGSDAMGGTQATGGSAATAGGILNSGALTLRNCTINQNSAQGGNGGNSALAPSNSAGAPGGAATGGAIFNSGTLVLIDCTLFGNSIVGGAGGKCFSYPNAGNGGAANGGGIANTGSLTVVSSTITSNSAAAGNGGNGQGDANGGAGGSVTGAGISEIGVSPALMARNAIFAANTAIAGTGGTVAPNTGKTAGANGTASGPDIFGGISSQGHNLVGRTDGNSGWTGTDLLGGTMNATRLDPLLGPLQDNGGPSFTVRPSAASAAIDNGDDAVVGAPLSLTSDQRGYSRKVGAHVDIGAVEIGILQPGPTFTVTNAGAHVDGSCTTDDCTFVEALNASNANANANTILFAPSVSGTISTVGLNSNDGLFITNPVTINGPGARVLRLSGGFSARILQITSANVVINGLTMAYGFVSQGSGGAITNSGGLTLQDCLIYRSLATGNDPVGFGGGIYSANGSTLTLNQCTVQSNEAGSYGGGVYTEGTFSATNCTFYDNSGLRGGGIIARSAAPTMTLHNCTLTGNTATDGVNTAGFGGGGVYAEGGAQQHFMANCIVAGNSSTNDPDVRGNYTSQGHNLIDVVGDAVGFGATGDQLGANGEQFDNFDNHGGSTDTWSLLKTSTAINAGDDNRAPATDQRGYLRSGTSDIGAFEYGGSIPVLKLRSIARLSNGVVRLQAVGVPNSSHTVEASSDPDSDTFTVIGAATSNATGALQYDDTVPSNLTNRFYRLSFP